MIICAKTDNSAASRHDGASHDHISLKARTVNVKPVTETAVTAAAETAAVTAPVPQPTEATSTQVKACTGCHCCYSDLYK
jgi:hypothetical protein